MKEGTVALLVRFEKEVPVLTEVISDETEIKVLETALVEGRDPAEKIKEHRETEALENEEFGDYVEELLSQPFVRPEIQVHGVQWLKSKIRIDQFKRTEEQAAKVIAEYAYEIFKKNHEKTDFILVGPTAKVRILIFETQRVNTADSSNSEVA